MAGLRFIERVVVHSRCYGSMGASHHGEMDVSACSIDGKTLRRKLDQRSSSRGGRIEFTEQAVLLFADTCGEVKGIHITAVATITELQPPQFVDLDADAGFILQRAKKRARGRVVGVNRRIALAEIADE